MWGSNEKTEQWNKPRAKDKIGCPLYKREENIALDSSSDGWSDQLNFDGSVQHENQCLGIGGSIGTGQACL